MEFINYKVGECIQFSTPSSNNIPSVRFGVIVGAVDSNNMKVTILSETAAVIDRLFSMHVLEETQVTVTVAKDSIVKNILVLCEKYYDAGGGGVRKFDATVDIFEGMKDIYAVANTNTRACFTLPNALYVCSRRDLKNVSLESLSVYDERSTLEMHLCLTSLTRKIQSGLRSVQVKRQKIFTTEECSFSLYFIHYLRNLLLKCGCVEENVVSRSNTQDKHCLVRDAIIKETFIGIL
jgi:hypothetical protein